MLKALSFIPKTLHLIYSMLSTVIVISLWTIGAVGMVAGVLLWLLYAFIGFLISCLVTGLIAIPNRLLLKWARSWDPEYYKDKLDSLQNTVKRGTDVIPHEINGKGNGDLSDLVASTVSGKSGDSKWTKS